MNWQRLSLTLSLVAIGIGLTGFAGWTFGIDALTRIHPAWVTMKANTALCLMLTGTAAAILRDAACGGLRRRLAQGCGAVVAAVGTLTFAEIIFDWDLGIDQALFQESLAGAGRSFPGRMGPASALIFMLLGAAIMLLDVRTRRGVWPAQLCVVAASALKLAVFLCYFYEVDLPPALKPYFSIALHTVIAFLLLCVALLIARPERGFVAVFLTDNTGGEIARRMLPTALLVPALLGWLFVLGRQAGYFGEGVAVSLLAASITVIFSGLVWWAARALGRSDAQRSAAETGRAQLAAIVASSDDAIVSKSLAGIVTSWNEGAARLFGYPAEEMIGQPIMRIIPANRQDEEHEILRRLRAGEHLEHFETVRVTKDRRLIDVSLTVSPVRVAAGVVVGASKIARDIAQRKQIEAELRAARDAAESANRAKDEFLAALSHELRTPLTPVLMLAADKEQAAELPAAVRADFAMIRKNVELEARIIDDLLDLTRITHGKLALRFEAVEAHGLIAHALAILRSDREGKNIALSLDLAAAEPHVRGDAVRLQQVVWNVLKNAIKFTPAGGRIAIRSWNEDGEWRAAFTDSGLGITAEEMPRIFTAFAQGREAAAARFGGLGLGLSITALLMHEHGGRIWAESAGRERGATFHLSLPLAASPAPASDAAPPAAVPPAPTLRILLVEDHDDTRAVMQRLLTRWGHTVTLAASVAQARAALAGSTFDLLLSDVGLPDGTGHEVIAALREKSAAPAVAMSGYGMEADIRRVLDAGFAEHLVKPVAAGRLRELLTHFAAS